MKRTPSARAPARRLLSWLPRIVPEMSKLDGAQIADTQFLDPFASARRNPRPSTEY